MVEQSLLCPACDQNLITKRNYSFNNKSVVHYQCENCGHTFRTDYLNSNAGFSQDSYVLENKNIPRFDRDLKLARTLVSSFIIDPGSTILDFGAGLGGLSLRLAEISKEFSLDLEIICFEPVIRLAENLRQKNHRIKVYSEFQDLNKADFIIAKEVIEHCNEPFSFLQNLKTKMNPNASLLITCPGHANALSENPGNLNDYFIKEHLHFFTKKSMLKLIHRTKAFNCKTLSLIDQYPNQAEIDYTDNQKNFEILKMISNRHFNEVNHLQMLLRLK